MATGQAMTTLSTVWTIKSLSLSVSYLLQILKLALANLWPKPRRCQSNKFIYLSNFFISNVKMATGQAIALGDNKFFTWMNIFFEWIILDFFEWIDSLNE